MTCRGSARRWAQGPAARQARSGRGCGRAARRRCAGAHCSSTGLAWAKPEPSGKKGTKAIPRAAALLEDRHRARSTRLSGFCTHAIGVRSRARSRWSRVMLLRPTPPISPSSRAWTIAASWSSNRWPGLRAVEEPQVDGGQLPDAEAAQVVLDSASQLIRVVVGQPATGLVAACSDLADQRQGVRVGVQRLADELVGDAGPVVLRGVDVVHTQFHGAPQHRQRLVTVTRRTEDARAGQLHRTEADARYREKAEKVAVHALILNNRACQTSG